MWTHANFFIALGAFSALSLLAPASKRHRFLDRTTQEARVSLHRLWRPAQRSHQRQPEGFFSSLFRTSPIPTRWAMPTLYLCLMGF